MYVYKILFGHDILKIYNLCLYYIDGSWGKL